MSLLTSLFDVTFHLFRNSILISTHHEKVAPGTYYMVEPNLSKGESRSANSLTKALFGCWPLDYSVIITYLCIVSPVGQVMGPLITSITYLSIVSPLGQVIGRLINLDNLPFYGITNRTGYRTPQ